MKLSAFRTRILLGAVLVATLAILLAAIAVGQAARQIDPTLLPFSDEFHVACEAAPHAYQGILVGPIRISAKATPDGLPQTELAIGGSYAFERGGERVLVKRMAESGPCAWMMLSIGAPEVLRRAVPFGLAIGTFVAMLAVALATNVITVAPLLRRIQRIRSAAVVVGEETYRSENDEVGDALAEIAHVLDQSHDRIVTDRKELVRRHVALERYMAELAHDLRVPLASLVLGLQEVLASAPGAEEPAKRALSDAHYVSGLVENLHEAARLRHGLDPMAGRTDLRDVVSRLEVRFSAVGHAADVAVAAAVPEHPVWVRCTPALAERAIGNLLQNAVIHGGSHVAALLRVEGDTFELEVIDDGAGLAESALADLALRTFTDDAARPRGPGLGIAITNEVARRVGWRIAYEQADEGGLCVRLTGATVAGA
ncbi:MAG: HAMP domain-containing sensor histidine kinase [Myxococcota bacterium]